MQKNYFSTNHVSRRERLEFWHELVCDYLLDSHATVTPPENDSLKAEIILHDLGRMKMMQVASFKSLVIRNNLKVRQAEDEFVLFLLQLQGVSTFQQAKRTVCLKPGDMTLYDSTMPHSLDVAEGYSGLILRINRDDAVRRIPSLSKFTAVALPNSEGIGRVTNEIIRSTFREIDSLPDTAKLTVTEMIWDSIAHTANSLVPDAKFNAQITKSKLALLHRIKAYIEIYLTKPFLTPQHIAAKHNISIRYLNKLFEMENTSVTRWIRKRRLDRCAKEISLPTTSCGRHISEIAYDFGFNNISYFSREFKKAYGCTAKEYRLSSADNARTPS